MRSLSKFLSTKPKFSAGYTQDVYVSIELLTVRGVNKAL